MKSSIQDQFLKAGLITKKQLQATKKARKEEKKLINRGLLKPNQTQKNIVSKVISKKKERDFELNFQIKERKREKIVADRVSQIIACSNPLNLEHLENTSNYYFIDRKKVRKILVNTSIRNSLAKGLLGILKQETGYTVVERKSALRIQEFAPHYVILLQEVAQEPGEDLYPNHLIPDDLIW